MEVFWIKFGLFAFSAALGASLGYAGTYPKTEDFPPLKKVSIPKWLDWLGVTLWIASLAVIIATIALFFLGFPPAEYGLSYAVIPAIGIFLSVIAGSLIANS